MCQQAQDSRITSYSEGRPTNYCRNGSDNDESDDEWEDRHT
jgi:hypothetical protein